jgi:hypothetical protein
LVLSRCLTRREKTMSVYKWIPTIPTHYIIINLNTVAIISHK